MNKEAYNLYFIGKPESGQYMSRRGGPSINDRCVYKLVNELKKKGIEIKLEDSKAGYVEPVSRFNQKEIRGECCIADDKNLKEKYVFLNYFLKAEEVEIFLEDVSKKDAEGIHCHLNFGERNESSEKKILDDVNDVLTRFYGFECKEVK